MRLIKHKEERGVFIESTEAYTIARQLIDMSYNMLLQRFNPSISKQVKTLGIKLDETVHFGKDTE